MGYALVKAPVWVVGVASGAIWALSMLVLPTVRDVRTAMVVLVGGAVLGTFMAFLTRKQRRRNFTVDGRELTGPERAAVLRAVFDGEHPTDDHVRVAARRFAERFAAPAQRWWIVYVVFGAMTALSAWLAVSESPWWWLAVVGWPVGAWLVVWHTRRQRATVERYLRGPAPERVS
ncbi:hypothetical protein GCM10009557_41230 [Virgisporangium ochraceum]|uniref:Uncharacterized protein n=1 Tax=Virgisporangium ochraceum TaxID=65505 RepID=A0A8J3ZN11_9ACTN|nr:hypothetical protein [Virgisporangium ochraceum]GIJ66646.1 hypothetical protein Voc01_015630 [Virgisporangium ochraceum]